MTTKSFFISLDKEALRNNVKYLEKYKNKKILPVIKANAYGHGILLMAKALYDLEIKDYAVARFSEALNLIEYFNSFNITDYNIVVFESIDNYEIIKENNNIILTINNMEELKKAIKNNIPTKRLSIKIDFAYGRNGIKEDEVEELHSIIKYNSLKFYGIFSHLFSSTYEDGLVVIRKFTEVVNKLGRKNFEMIHLQNTAGTYNYDCEIVTHVRVGVMLYGMQETGYFDVDLKPIFSSLEGKVDSVKNVKDLKYIAYEKLSILDSDTTKVAKIKIGYGDGFIKANEGTYCLINKKEYRIVQVTMDNTFVEVDDRVKAGDTVYLYYRPLELPTTVGQKLFQLLILLSPLRVKRIWKGEKNKNNE